jgi:hypothetical protein
LISGQWSLVIGEEEEKAPSSSSFSISAFQIFSFYPKKHPSSYPDMMI